LDSRINTSTAQNSVRIKFGDILFAGSGETFEEIGKCVAYAGKEDAYAGGDIVVFTPSKDDPIFLGYLLNSNVVAEQKAKLGQGSSVIHIYSSGLKKISIPLPPTLPEQRAIATALSDVDALIRRIGALIDKKRAIKQGAMQELLTGKRRLEGFGGEWEIKTLGEICDIVSGGTPKTTKSEFWNGDIKWCTPTDITSCKTKYLFETKKTITKKGLDSSSAQLLPLGTLLLCSRATIGEIKIAGIEICTNQGFKSLICKPTVSNEFLYYRILQSKSLLIEKAIGSTFLEISKKGIREIEFRIPLIEEQRAIAQILSDMDAEIEALQEKQAKYQAVKQGMMQELLTGKTRLV